MAVSCSSVGSQTSENRLYHPVIEATTIRGRFSQGATEVLAYGTAVKVGEIKGGGFFKTVLVF
jgi:hypothetical protein